MTGFLYWLALPIASGGLILFAQVAVDDVPDWLTGGGTLVGTAGLVWFARHTMTTTIPGLVKDFREEMKCEREHHDKRCDKLTDSFTATLSQQHAEHRKDFEGFRESLHKLRNEPGVVK